MSTPTEQQVKRAAKASQAMTDAISTLHGLQCVLRELELPEYPAGGLVGAHNLDVALDKICNAQCLLSIIRDQMDKHRQIIAKKAAGFQPTTMRPSFIPAGDIGSEAATAALAELQRASSDSAGGNILPGD